MTDPVPPPASDGADPSMEEILASIRRILNEDEASAGGEGTAAEPEDADDDVLVLDRSMLVSAPDPGAERPSHAPEEPAPEAAAVTAGPAIQPPSLFSPPPFNAPPEPIDFEPPTPPVGLTLVAPETAAAAASSVDGLLRTLAASRSSRVYRGGPTIEDLVREEIRPLLKDWLDTHLPPLVERLVQTEIERVVGRSIS